MVMMALGKDSPPKLGEECPNMTPNSFSFVCDNTWTIIDQETSQVIGVPFHASRLCHFENQ